MAGLAFWFASSSDDASIPIVKREMASLRQKVESSSHAFQPHVTLLASLKEEASFDRHTYWKEAQQLVQDWRQQFDRSQGQGLEVNLLQVCTRGWYFQNILISLDPNPLLLSLNETLRKAFDQEDQPSYFPHISLLYSSLSGQEAQKIIDEMEKNGVWKRKDESHETGCWFGSCEAKIDKVTLKEVQLWDCNGEVGDWRLLNRMQL